MYCKNCGKEISDDSRYCKYCGADMDGGFGESSGSREAAQSRKPLYIGIGIAVLVIVLLCVFFIVRSMSADKAADTAQSEMQSVQSEETAAKQPSADEDGNLKSPDGNTYNYYYYNAGTPGDYENSSRDGYLWPSDSAYITYSDLSGYSKKQVEAIRNEIYARHGYVFKTDEWSSYFRNRSWYSPDSSYSDSRLSPVERENIQTIVQYEKDQGWK